MHATQIQSCAYIIQIHETGRLVTGALYRVHFLTLVLTTVPFSGGSSLEGHFSAPHGGISIDFTHMDKVVAFHESE